MTAIDLPAGGGWEGPIAGRLTNLAGARVVAQVLGLGWFLYAARVFDVGDFGVLSTGLALVVIVGGFSDLGTTRTVVRHVAADHRSMWPTFVRAATLRVGSGALVGAIAAGVLAVFEPRLRVAVVVAAAVVAVASGVTEVGFATLRAVGRVGTEVGLLVGERTLFLLLGVAVVRGGGDPVAVLAVYAGTNLVSALVVTWRVARCGRRDAGEAGPMLDREGRRTALTSSLVIVGPRVSVLVLLLIASPAVLGTYTIAQKVPEALGTLGTAALMPVLALLRAAHDSDRWSSALARAAAITAAVAAAVAPVVAWLTLDGNRFLALLFDAGGRRGIRAALAFLAMAALLWIVRTLAEMVLLAQERASVYLRALVVGTVINAVIAFPLVVHAGAAGAAGAALVGEMAVLLAVTATTGPERAVLSRPVVVALVALGVGAAVGIGGRHLPVVAAGAAVGLAAFVCLAVVGRSVLERRGISSRAPGDHTDIGAEIGGHLVGDSVEAVEHGSGPAQHL